METNVILAWHCIWKCLYWWLLSVCQISCLYQKVHNSPEISSCRRTRRRGQQHEPWRWKADMVIHPYCCWIVTNSPHVNAENCNGCMYNAISKILWDGFVSHYVLQMQWNELKLSMAFTAKTLLIFLELYIFEFLINTALTDSNSVYRKNFMGKNIKHN